MPEEHGLSAEQTGEPAPAQPNRFAFAPLLLALAVLLAFHLWCQPTQLAHYTDPIIYLSGAESLAEGRGYRFIAHAGEPRIGCHPPLQAAYLSLFWKLNPHFPENMWLLYAGMFICALVTFVLFYRYCLNSGVPAIVAALLILAWGLSAQWAPLVYGFMSDVLFGALALLLGNYWLKAGDVHSVRRWFMTGTLVALMYLCRTAAAAVIGVLACVVAFQSWKRRDFKPLLVYLAPIVTAVIAWKLWAAGSPGYGDYIGTRIAELGGWREVFRYNFDSAITYLSGLGLSLSAFSSLMNLPANPAIARSVWSSILTGVTLMLCWAFTFFWVVGCWRAKKERIAGLVVAAYLLQLCLYPAGLGERVLYAVLPFVLIWAWKGTSLLPSKLIQASSWKWAVALCLGAITVGNAFEFVHATRYLNTCSHSEELAEVGAWLRTNSPPETVVAATLTEPVTHFYHYSGRRVVENYFQKKPTFSVAAGSTNGAPAARYVLLNWYSSLKPEDLDCRLELAKGSAHGYYRLFRVLAPGELATASR